MKVALEGSSETAMVRSDEWRNRYGNRRGRRWKISFLGRVITRAHMRSKKVSHGLGAVIWPGIRYSFIRACIFSIAASLTEATIGPDWSSFEPSLVRSNSVIKREQTDRQNANHVYIVQLDLESVAKIGNLQCINMLEYIECINILKHINTLQITYFCNRLTVEGGIAWGWISFLHSFFSTFLDKQTNRRTDGRKTGRTDRQTDGWTDGH